MAMHMASIATRLHFPLNTFSYWFRYVSMSSAARTRGLQSLALGVGFLASAQGANTFVTTTHAGDEWYFENGSGTNADFRGQNDISFYGSDLFVLEKENTRVRRVTTDGESHSFDCSSQIIAIDLYHPRIFSSSNALCPSGCYPHSLALILRMRRCGFQFHGLGAQGQPGGHGHERGLFRALRPRSRFC